MKEDSFIAKVLGVLAVLSLFAVFLSILGFVVSGIMLYQSWADAKDGDPTPQRMKLVKLLTAGPGNNRHITITDFTVGADFLTIQEGGLYQTYLLVSPSDDRPGADSQVLIIHIDKWEPYFEAISHTHQQVFTGMYEDSGSLGWKSRQLLQEKYPKLDVGKAPFLEVRQYRGGRFSTARIIAGISMGICVVCVPYLIWAFRRDKAMRKAREEGAYHLERSKDDRL